jgi:hypothetical protein
MKHRPLPLSPDSPDVEVISGPVAPLLRALWSGMLDTTIDSSVSIPNPWVMRWKDIHLDCREGSWIADAGGLELELRRPTFGGDEQLEKMFNVLNQGAEFDLADGSLLTSRLVHLTGSRNEIHVERRLAMATYEMSLDSWTWWPSKKDALWIGRIDAPRIDDGNLVVCVNDGSWTSRCYRLRGNYILYLLQDRKRQTTTLVIDTEARTLEHGLIGTDITALEFALGCPVRLDHLLALDEDHRVVGAAGVELGGSTSEANRRCPVAMAIDLYANYGKADREYSWIPVLFALVAERLHSDGPDSSLLTAVAMYVYSSSAGNIHVSYLLVQIALEALCKTIVGPTSDGLVTDPKKWLAFVAEHERQIKSLARDEEAARKLLNKVRTAQQAPSTDRVAAALRHFDLEVPKIALDEIAKRNRSAHELLMQKESTADVQELANRLAVVQTLMAAVVAKHVGFNGPITGWDWVRGRLNIPEWWPWEVGDEARRKYMVPPEQD